MRKILPFIAIIALTWYMSASNVCAQTQETSVDNQMYSSMTGGTMVYNAADTPSETDSKVRTFLQTFFSTEVLQAPGFQPSEKETVWQEQKFFTSDELFTREELSAQFKDPEIIVQSNGRRVFDNKSTGEQPRKIFTLPAKPVVGNNIKGKVFQVEGKANGLLETTVELAVASAYNGYEKDGLVVNGAFPYRILITVTRQTMTESISNGTGASSNGATIANDIAAAIGAGTHNNKSATRTYYVDIVKVYTYNDGIVPSSVSLGNINQGPIAENSYADGGLETIYFDNNMKPLPGADKQLASNIKWLSERWPEIEAQNLTIRITGIGGAGADLTVLKQMVRNTEVLTTAALKKLNINPGNRLEFATMVAQNSSTNKRLNGMGAVAAITFNPQSMEKK